MALRDRLATRVQPYLEPGEQVRQVFYGQTGPNPWFGALSSLIVLFGAKYRIVAVTDRSITVVDASKLVPSKPKGEHPVAKLPRSVQLGPVKGLWDSIHATGERIWVHKRFHKDIAAADADLGMLPGGGPVQLPSEGQAPGQWGQAPTQPPAQEPGQWGQAPTQPPSAPPAPPTAPGPYAG